MSQSAFMALAMVPAVILLVGWVVEQWIAIGKLSGPTRKIPAASDSHSAPEPMANRFDSDAADQLSSEERMRRFDDALRADYSLQDALDFNLAAKAAGGTA